MGDGSGPGIGVDVADLGRIFRSVERRRGKLARRVLSDVERRWVDAGDSVVRLAACFALKEAAIKALGARPRPFAWTGLRTRPADDGAAWMASQLGELGARDVAWASVNEAPAAWGVDDHVVIALVSDGRRPTSVGTGRVVVEPDVTQHGAGRRAADAAVRSLLPDSAGQVEIRSGVHPPDDLSPCHGSHPPVVAVDGQPGDIAVSISHCPTVAVAVAWRH
jgi:phosphopantetheinyl transferase (holo-ACP synthase)